MRLLYHSLNPSETEIRSPTPHDRAAIERLLEQADYQYSTLIENDLALLLEAPLGALLWSDSQLIALLLAGLAPTPVSWIRAVAVDKRLRLSEAMPLLLDTLHSQAAAHQLRQIFFTGDVWSSAWIQPYLKAGGYHPVEEIITCEKRHWEIPSTGSARLDIRPVERADIPSVAAIDRAAFEPQWVKLPPILDHALQSAALFLLAEDRGQPVGYALATSHYEGRLTHLVRLAVLPERHGQGIGTRLLAEVVGFCRRHDTQVLSLNTQVSNTSARRLYEWFGFRPTGDRQSVLRRDL